jgi:5-methyltetrahydrofolate--homocysteine methyltransferase
VKSFLEEIKDRVLVFDGSKGSMLQQLGMKGGECPELWNVTHAGLVKEIYQKYKEAGSDVIQTNTFQGNRNQLEKYSLGGRTYELNFEGTRLAREVMGKEGFVAASIGPVGKLFEPSGDLTFEACYEIFKEQLRGVVDGGADIINYETFTDLAEMRAALLAAKETTGLPVICSLAFESNRRTMMGTDPYTAVAVLKSLGADMVGTNCSFGPQHLLEVIKEMSGAGGGYLSVKPNAGIPEMINGEPVYRESPEDFAKKAARFVNYGVRLIGGCCGTTPEFIAEISRRIKGLKVPEVLVRNEQVIASGVRTLFIKDLKKANLGKISVKHDEDVLKGLFNGDLEIIEDLSMDLSAEDYDAIYINVDGASEDEKLLANVINIAQGYIKAPFVIETGNPKALDYGLRIFKGKAGVVVNRYNEKTAEQLIRTAKKYGSAVLDHTATPILF